MKHSLIEITVSGAVGSGKSHVLATIEKALIKEYGAEIHVVSHELRNERSLVGDDENMTRPSKTTIFAMGEQGPSRATQVDFPLVNDAPRLKPM